MLEVDVESKSFGQTQVLRDVRFSLNKGDSLAILGPSGVGKTTLLRLIAGIDTAFEGKISVASPKQAIVFQEPALLPWRTARDNLAVVHPTMSANAIMEILARVGLENNSDHFPSQLSLGQQRRLSLARAFASRPDILLMDEPFASLDPATAERMMELTRTLMAEVKPSLILVTHVDAEARKLAGSVQYLSGQPATLNCGLNNSP